MSITDEGPAKTAATRMEVDCSSRVALSSFCEAAVSHEPSITTCPSWQDEPTPVSAVSTCSSMISPRRPSFQRDGVHTPDHEVPWSGTAASARRMGGATTRPDYWPTLEQRNAAELLPERNDMRTALAGESGRALISSNQNAAAANTSTSARIGITPVHATLCSPGGAVESSTASSATLAAAGMSSLSWAFPGAGPGSCRPPSSGAKPTSVEAAGIGASPSQEEPVRRSFDEAVRGEAAGEAVWTSSDFAVGRADTEEPLRTSFNEDALAVMGLTPMRFRDATDLGFSTSGLSDGGHSSRRLPPLTAPTRWPRPREKMASARTSPVQSRPASLGWIDGFGGGR
mmetsp:Transcript_118559/g.340423  ORF Transcript_118559/g.340423 Transcript_118559/m.340423 type:complete len:343 (-) Transcript_118559:148-1176(-)